MASKEGAVKPRLDLKEMEARICDPSTPIQEFIDLQARLAALRSMG